MTPQQKVVSQYPLPPVRYYRNFNAVDPAPPPPPPSSDQTYHMFGGEYSVEDNLPTLEEAGRKSLYDSSAPPCQELKRLNKQLLEQFLQLVSNLCEPLPPDAPEDPHKDTIVAIEDIFVNMQHLINTMRPAQAAIDLKILLDRQTESRKHMVEQLKDSVNKAWELIGEAAGKLSEGSVDVSDEAKGTDEDAMRETDDNSQAMAENGASGEMKGDIMDQIANIVADTSL